MLENLPKHSLLLIVSDTPMWQTPHGVMVFEPTLREVEWLAEIVESITWIGYGHLGSPKSFARLTTKSNINFVVLPYAVGGNSLIQKMKIIRFIPMMVLTILRLIRKHQYIHTRGPAVPALIAILISYFDQSRTYWHKYAGNWKQDPAPWAYALQRFLLRHNPYKVSVNGIWPGEPKNIICLENPCLTIEELTEANKLALQKPSLDLINLCFVGALIPAKGIHQFVEALFKISHKDGIGEVCIAGDGSERMALESKTAELPFNIKFLGDIKRNEINEVYKQSHIIVLPSETEGFPKVIAEAAAFGCIPIVTDVSSIGQYIKHEQNGLLLVNTQSDTIAAALNLILDDKLKIERMRNEAIMLSSLFTYERYCERVSKDLFEQCESGSLDLQNAQV